MESWSEEMLGLYLKIAIDQGSGELFRECVDRQRSAVLDLFQDFISPYEDLRSGSTPIEHGVIHGRIVGRIENAMVAEQYQ